MATGAKSKSPHVGQATSNTLKSISGGKILSSTVTLGNGLSLQVIWFFIRKLNSLRVNKWVFVFKICKIVI